MNSKKFNGDRLKSARLYRGLTIEQLAEKINVTKQTISQYENNKIIPEFEKMLLISSELKFPYEYFIQQTQLSVKSASTYFRSQMTTNKRYRTEQIIKMEHLSSIYHVLSEYISFPELNLPKIDDNATPTEVAHYLRQFWKLGNEPIKNLISVLESNGLIVTTFQTSTDKIDAFSHLIEVEDQEIFIIALSSNKNSAVRKHFDLAHELGHILLHDWWSDDTESFSREEFKLKEQEANQFAAAFLLPEKEFLFDVKAFPTNIDYYIQLKKKWKVSMSAMMMRAYNLEAISLNQYQYMMKVMQAKGYRTNEPLDDTLYTYPPSLLKNAVNLLLEENVFKPKEFVEEVSKYGIPLLPNDIEILLNLDKETLTKQEISQPNIIQLKQKVIKN